MKRIWAKDIGSDKIMNYRHEIKFLVSDLDLEKIKHRLDALMTIDAHQIGDSYIVRSLYFDDVYDSCLTETIEGIDNRKKYRIRTYNRCSDIIRLEEKSKLHNMTRKDTRKITLEDAIRYINGEAALDEHYLSTKLNALIQSKNMHPVCIVEYDRTAYIEEVGNVRITFDCDLRGSLYPEYFFDDTSAQMLPILPPGIHVLEVKYDEFLPSYILQAIDINTLEKTSMSKYKVVRNVLDGKE